MFWDGTRWVEDRPAPGAPTRRTIRDWLATIPIILLVPALAVPWIVAGANTPTLTVSGTEVPGSTLNIGGTDFTPRDRLQIAWDGSSSGMPSVKVNGQGRFATTATVPANATAGTHVVSALRVSTTRTTRTSSALALATTTDSAVVAETTVTVVDPADPSTSPAPTASAPAPTGSTDPSSTPSTSADPSAIPTGAPTPTPTGSPGSTGTPGPTATPAPTSTPTPAPTSSFRVVSVSAGSITTSSATITFTLSEPGTGQVEYGLTTSYGATSAEETSFDYTTHIQTLVGLAQGTTYHYRVRSQDQAGDVVTSSDRTFTTVDPTPSPTPTPTPTSGGSCTTSVSSGGSIQSALNATPDGGTLCLSGSYNLGSAGVLISGRSGITIDGNGATITASGCSPSSAMFLLQNSSHITIHDAVLRGTNSAGGTSSAYHAGCEDQGGVMVYGGTDVEAYNLTIQDTYGECVYVDAGGSPRGTGAWASYVYFHDSVCKDNGRMGVAIAGGSNVTIARNTFTNIAISVLDVEPYMSIGGATYVKLQNNTVNRYGLTGSYTGWLMEISAMNGLSGLPLHDFTVSGNNVLDGSQAPAGSPATTGGSDAGLALKSIASRVKNISVTGNTTGASGKGPVMLFQHVDGVTVSGNSQPLTSGSLVSTSDCSGVSVS